MNLHRRLVFVGALVALGVGCTLAVQFDDRTGDSGPLDDDAGVERDGGVNPDQDTGSSGDTGTTFDPVCVKSSAAFTGLPRDTSNAVVDAGSSVVCCEGHLTDLTKPEHCGGCTINCNFGGSGYACETFVGDAGAHPYCTGCRGKFPADQTMANASCQSALCSGSPPFADAGRCAPSNGSSDCPDIVCAQTYGGAVCARYPDGGPRRDPSFFCVYQ